MFETVKRYIANQREHHRHLTFRDEYLQMLKKHRIEFEMKYVFESENVG